MKTSTAGLITALSGFAAVLSQGALSFMTLVGTGLASTPDNRVPDRAAELWSVALWGTPVVGIALLVLLFTWTKLVVLIYALIWLVLVGCYCAGWVLNGTSTPIPLVLAAALPFTSTGFGLYGVWRYRNHPEEPRNPA